MPGILPPELQFVESIWSGQTWETSVPPMFTMDNTAENGASHIEAELKSREVVDPGATPKQSLYNSTVKIYELEPIHSYDTSTPIAWDARASLPVGNRNEIKDINSNIPRPKLA